MFFLCSDAESGCQGTVRVNMLPSPVLSIFGFEVGS